MLTPSANHRTGEQATLTFKPRTWRGKDAFEIKGEVVNAQGRRAWDIAGRTSIYVLHLDPATLLWLLCSTPMFNADAQDGTLSSSLAKPSPPPRSKSTPKLALRRKSICCCGKTAKSLSNRST